jgi:uncharacterized protein (TIGR02246 family)
MNRFRRAASLALAVGAMSGCSKSASSSADTSAAATVANAPAPDAAADDQAIRSASAAWFTAYNSRALDTLVALYTDDATLNVPGHTPFQGSAAIRDAYTKDLADATKAGLSMKAGSNPKFTVSGDMGSEWNTFTMTDKSGKTVAAGKYITVFARKDGKWLISHDIWNLDT